MIEGGLRLGPGTADSICESLESEIDKLVDWTCEDHVDVVINRVVDGKIFSTSVHRLQTPPDGSSATTSGICATSVGPDGLMKRVELNATVFVPPRI
ncbi:hypothetical protein C6Y44_04110 [Rhodococcus rhodochrous]|nr:hypothetical protein C6Y44_04110 [Rhodococcus rhodochrous]